MLFSLKYIRVQLLLIISLLACGNALSCVSESVLDENQQASIQDVVLNINLDNQPGSENARGVMHRHAVMPEATDSNYSKKNCKCCDFGGCGSCVGCSGSCGVAVSSVSSVSLSPNKQLDLFTQFLAIYAPPFQSPLEYPPKHFLTISA